MNTHVYLKSNAHPNAPIQSKLLMTNHEFTGGKKKKKILEEKEEEKLTLGFATLVYGW